MAASSKLDLKLMAVSDDQGQGTNTSTAKVTVDTSCASGTKVLFRDGNHLAAQVSGVSGCCAFYRNSPPGQVQADAWKRLI
jgi:hypothetical protein